MENYKVRFIGFLVLGAVMGLAAGIMAWIFWEEAWLPGFEPRLLLVSFATAIVVGGSFSVFLCGLAAGIIKYRHRKQLPSGFLYSWWLPSLLLLPFIAIVAYWFYVSLA